MKIVEDEFNYYIIFQQNIEIEEFIFKSKLKLLAWPYHGTLANLVIIFLKNMKLTTDSIENSVGGQNFGLIAFIFAEKDTIRTG